MTHREACYELRRSARLLGEGKLTLHEWHASVLRILSARGPVRQAAAEGAAK